MAEVVGLVVGLASFGVQLLESTKKLRTLCEDIKDAPVELQDTIEGIEIMSEIISLMAPIDGQPYAEGAVLARTIELCRKALDRLSAVTSDLQKRLQSSKKTRGRFSVVLKKDSMDRLVGRLEQCKGSLQLAHQLYMGARNMSRFDHQERALEELRNDQVTLVSQCMTRAVYQTSSTNELQAGEVVSTEDVVSNSTLRQPSTSRRLPGRQQPLFSFRLRTPQWTFSRVMELTLAHVHAGWTASLQFYRIVDPDDPFMSACSENELVVVKEMLQAKKATVYDIFHNGQPAIDWAMTFGSFDVSKYLYQHGAVPSSEEASVSYSCGLCYNRPASKQVQSDQLIWATSKNLCVDTLEQLGLDQSNDVFEHPLVQLWVAPSDRLSIAERLTLMVQIIDYLPTSTEAVHRKWSLLEEIGGSPFDMALFDAVSDYRDTLFGALAYLFTQCFECRAYKAKEQPLLTEMIPIFVRGVTYGADLTARDDQDGKRWWALTPLGALLSQLRRIHPRKAASEYNLLLRTWVQMLANCGVDLMAYGELELGTDCDYTLYFDIVKILGFAYGPEPKDWHLLFEAKNDHHIGQFWRMVEEPERQVPGAWIEEDSDQGGPSQELIVKIRMKRKLRKKEEKKSRKTKQAIPPF
ncbi:hypothetical protein PRZ48_002028 [Zasmidium cellare]|uniref:Fungal N-terminal domain-containing protein n=1 Tax=Zasmidium cellare TaxID=395010 RepID=A0ABR0F4S0_ZASCE|nr:hypothetical protein PRZ48_002028 [Zasmidium cellare]